MNLENTGLVGGHFLRQPADALGQNLTYIAPSGDLDADDPQHAPETQLDDIACFSKDVREISLAAQRVQCIQPRARALKESLSQSQIGHPGTFHHCLCHGSSTVW